MTTDGAAAPGADGAAPAGAEQPPLLRVVRGEPTAQELAALVAVLASRRQPAPAARAVDAWSDRARALRAPVLPGPGAWRGSALPG